MFKYGRKKGWFEKKEFKRGRSKGINKNQKIRTKEAGKKKKQRIRRVAEIM